MKSVRLVAAASLLAALFAAPLPQVSVALAADAASLRSAMEGCGPAFYLVHSMIAAGDAYAECDRAMARGFAAAAQEAGLERIVYLGGLGELGEGLSEHLASRREVEEVLASGRTPVTVLRAAMIIGSGSASFEILRYLVERLPVMVTPRWVMTESQPIAVRNVVQYLVDCLAVPGTVGRTLDIGGPAVLSYRDLMRIMAEERGLRSAVVFIRSGAGWTRPGDPGREVGRRMAPPPTGEWLPRPLRRSR